MPEEASDKYKSTAGYYSGSGIKVHNTPRTPSLPEKEYEPYDHRDVKHPTTFFETLMHLMKCSMGTGILAMPYAFSNAGFIVGTIGTLFIGLICTYSVHILISSEYRLCKINQKPSMSYPETAGAAFMEGPDKIKGFAKYVPATCNTFLLMYEIGSCAVYVIFIATNMKELSHISSLYCNSCLSLIVFNSTFLYTPAHPRTKSNLQSLDQCHPTTLFYYPAQFNLFKKWQREIFSLLTKQRYVINRSGTWQVIDEYQVPENRWDVRYYCIFVLPALILIHCIRNYKYLAPLSTIATVLTTISFVIIFYYLFSELPDLSSREAVVSVDKIPVFFGTVVFAMEAIGVVFPLENEMKNPRKFNTLFGVLNCAMIPITLLYTCVGLFGYLRYGNDVMGSITLSLPKQNISSQAVRVMLSVSIYFTHGLLLHAAIDIIWYEYTRSFFKTKLYFWEYIVRIIVVFITFLLAVTVPYLEQFISLIGALCMATLGLTFPAVIETCTFWYDYKGSKFTLFFLKNVFIFIFSIVGLVFGVNSSIMGMAEKFSENI